MFIRPRALTKDKWHGAFVLFTFTVVAAEFYNISSIIFFFSPLKRVLFFLHQHGKFFITQFEGLRTEDVVHHTDCKAQWGNVIVILGYINKIYLIWFNIQPNWLWGSGPDTDEMPSWAPAITTLISLWRLSSHLFSAIIVLIWKSWIAAKLEHKSVFTSGWSISINVAAKDARLLRPTQISFFVLWSESDFGCFENTFGTIQYLSTSACQKSAVVSGCEWGRAQFVQHALTPELSKNNVFFFFLDATFLNRPTKQLDQLRKMCKGD